MPIFFPISSVTLLARYGSPLPTWQQGLVATGVRVTLTGIIYEGDIPVTVSVFDNAPTINLVATDTKIRTSDADMVFDLPIFSNQYDLDRLTVAVLEGHILGSLAVEVFTNVSDFWTDFVKSYEIP